MANKLRTKFSKPSTTLNDPAVVSRRVTFQSIHERLILKLGDSNGPLRSERVRRWKDDDAGNGGQFPGVKIER